MIDIVLYGLDIHHDDGDDVLVLVIPWCYERTTIRRTRITSSSPSLI